MRFGKHQHRLAPHARYTLELPDGSWKTVSLDEFLEARGVAGKSALMPQCGTLEIFAQTATAVVTRLDSNIMEARI